LVFQRTRPGKIWMAADKKPLRKKTAQRPTSRPPAPGKKVAKAGASGAVGKSTVRAVASKAPAVKKTGGAKLDASRKAPPSKRGPQAVAKAKLPAKGSVPPPSARAKDTPRDKDKAREKAEKEKAKLKAAKDDVAKKQKDVVKKLAEREREKERERAEKEKAKLKASKDKDAARLAKEKAAEQQRLQREKQAEQARRDREKDAAKKHADREKAEQARLKAQAIQDKKLEKDREKAAKDAERNRILEDKQREKDRIAAEKNALREKQLAEKQDEKEAQRLEKEAEQQRLKAEKEAEKEAQRLEKEAERTRLKVEREEERQRAKAEREAERDRLREEARQKREEERSRREAEREAYRKAKESEQTRIRTERAAARRALEGRVAKASGRAGGRASTTTRVYSPSSIPDQSRTRRDGVQVFLGSSSAPPPSSAERSPAFMPKTRSLPPPPPPELPATIEERYAKLQARLAQTSEDFRNTYEENFVMSWIHHDSALEGVVYTYEELRTAVNPNVTVVPDSSLQSVCEEIRRHKMAIEVVRELGERKRQPATLEQLKRIFLTLHPEEGDLKTVRYRKEIPQHRMYFHEYAAPDKIPYKVRQVFDWLNGPEPKKLKSPLRVAGRVHYDLLRIFPFAKDSGKVARLFMNMLLLRADYPPAILHSTERQRYYEALKGAPNTICNMLESAIMNALQSIEKQLGTQDTRLRAIVS
jgi:hypothetical protein